MLPATSGKKQTLSGPGSCTDTKQKFAAWWEGRKLTATQDPPPLHAEVRDYVGRTKPYHWGSGAQDLSTTKAGVEERRKTLLPPTWALHPKQWQATAGERARVWRGSPSEVQACRECWMLRYTQTPWIPGLDWAQGRSSPLSEMRRCFDVHIKGHSRGKNSWAWWQVSRNPIETEKREQ